MKVFFFVIHGLVCAGLIAGILVHSAKSEGLGTLGGQTEAAHKAAPRGVDAMLDKFLSIFAWGFIGIAFLSSVLLPNFF